MDGFNIPFAVRTYEVQKLRCRHTSLTSVKGISNIQRRNNTKTKNCINRDLVKTTNRLIAKNIFIFIFKSSFPRQQSNKKQYIILSLTSRQANSGPELWFGGGQAYFFIYYLFYFFISQPATSSLPQSSKTKPILKKVGRISFRGADTKEKSTPQDGISR